MNKNDNNQYITKTLHLYNQKIKSSQIYKVNLFHYILRKVKNGNCIILPIFQNYLFFVIYYLLFLV